MSHYHDPGAATQNQGNVLGTRACVKQSWRAKQQESGNAVKGILGYGNIQWSATKRSTTVSQGQRQPRGGPHPLRKQGKGKQPATAVTTATVTKQPAAAAAAAAAAKQQPAKQQPKPKPKPKAANTSKPKAAAKGAKASSSAGCWTTSSSSYGAGL